MFDTVKKFFRRPTTEQRQIIVGEYNAFLSDSEERAEMMDEYYRKDAEKRNNTCPKCGGTEVVHKIARTHGSGSVSGGGFLSFNHVSGSSKMDTDPVNHCNGCGHQWKKVSGDFSYAFEHTRKALQKLSAHLIHGKELSNYYAKRFKGMKAESIWRLIDASRYKQFGDMSKVTLDMLKDEYKSIYDV